jgi:hypothetical protein
MHFEVPSTIEAKKLSFLASTFHSQCSSLNLVHNHYTFEATLQTMSHVPRIQSVSVPQKAPSTPTSYNLGL